jgi:hypothetical protein
VLTLCDIAGTWTAKSGNGETGASVAICPERLCDDSRRGDRRRGDGKDTKTLCVVSVYKSVICIQGSSSRRLNTTNRSVTCSGSMSDVQIRCCNVLDERNKLPAQLGQPEVLELILKHIRQSLSDNATNRPVRYRCRLTGSKGTLAKTRRCCRCPRPCSWLYQVLVLEAQLKTGDGAFPYIAGIHRIVSFVLSPQFPSSVRTSKHKVVPRKGLQMSGAVGERWRVSLGAPFKAQMFP